MPRRRPDTERAHVILRKGDMERLKALFPSVGPSTIIRSIVSNVVDALESRTLERITPNARLHSVIQTTLDKPRFALARDDESLEAGEPEEPDHDVSGASRRSVG